MSVTARISMCPSYFDWQVSTDHVLHWCAQLTLRWQLSRSDETSGMRKWSEGWESHRKNQTNRAAHLRALLSKGHYLLFPPQNLHLSHIGGTETQEQLSSLCINGFHSAFVSRRLAAATRFAPVLLKRWHFYVLCELSHIHLSSCGNVFQSVPFILSATVRHGSAERPWEISLSWAPFLCSAWRDSLLEVKGHGSTGSWMQNISGVQRLSPHGRRELRCPG